jgi:hypothetical protein
MKKDPRRERDEKAYKAGGGAWFRNSDFTQVVVEVSFYPRLKLWLIENGERRQITKDELTQNYSRLRL